MGSVTPCFTCLFSPSYQLLEVQLQQGLTEFMIVCLDLIMDFDLMTQANIFGILQLFTKALDE